MTINRYIKLPKTAEGTGGFPLERYLEERTIDNKYFSPCIESGGSVTHSAPNITISEGIGKFIYEESAEIYYFKEFILSEVTLEVPEGVTHYIFATRLDNDTAIWRISNNIMEVYDPHTVLHGIVVMQNGVLYSAVNENNAYYFTDKYAIKGAITGWFEHGRGASISTTSLGLEVTNGTFYQGVVPFHTPSLIEWTYWYKNGVTWNQVANVTALDNKNYNEHGTGLLPLDAGKFSSHWLYIVFGSNHTASLHIVYDPTNGYNTLEEAIAGLSPAELPPICGLYGISTFIGKVVTQESDDTQVLAILSAFTSSLNAQANTNNHNSLSGLQGGSLGDYQHLTVVEVAKLAGIADNANNYMHPATHSPDIIVQDTNNRFVTDVEKSAWNAKEDGFVKNTAFNKNYSTTETDIKMNGVQSLGVLDTLARADHVHPTDTTRASTDVVTTVANGLMSSGDKIKLNGIADNANNYTHPATHSPNIIVQDTNNRFVTDGEKSAWNAKLEEAPVDGSQYARKNASWVPVESSGGGGVTAHNDLTGRDVAGNHSLFTPVTDTWESFKFARANGDAVFTVDTTNAWGKLDFNEDYVYPLYPALSSVCSFINFNGSITGTSPENIQAINIGKNNYSYHNAGALAPLNVIVGDMNSVISQGLTPSTSFAIYGSSNQVLEEAVNPSLLERYGVILGYANTIGGGSVVDGSVLSLGVSCSVNGHKSSVIGFDSVARGENTLSLGNGASCTANRAMAIGFNVSNNSADTILLGAASGSPITVSTTHDLKIPSPSSESDTSVLNRVSSDGRYPQKSQVSGTVIHGSNASVARPAGFANITWVGSVEPTNAENNDIWVDTSA